ncbi:MAG TPA: Uma2 family endonuclease [Lacipirellulaceae bacterium]|nr:Uma2 family endonuclease [Lacipirellulaceae bacterium]HMP08380.1 Uma2 family endonuclease [Lacipirellulaceae bacterium]
MSAFDLPTPQSPPIIGEPAWDVALLYPLQGGWTEDDYLAIALRENWLIEYTDGCVEVLPMPTIEHQLLVRFLLNALRAFVEPRTLGMVLFAPLPIKLRVKAYREPDLIFNFTENHARNTKDYYETADLVMEVVSPDKRSHERDYQDKRADYAAAGIREYWIVDPQEQRVTVLALEGGVYVEHCVVQAAGAVTSRLLEGFAVDAASLFAARKT